MPTTPRAINKQQNALIESFVVKAASAVTEGMPVTLDAEGVVLDSAAGENAIGIALATQTAGLRVSVALFGSSIVPCKVGTAGCTAGKYAIVGTTGLVDQTLGGGTTVKYISGRFLQTGVSGDKVGLLIGGSFAGVA